MTVFSIEFTKQARQDRQSIYSWIAKKSSDDRARRFVGGLLDECASLEVSPMRGTLHLYRGKQFRTIGYKRAVSVLFAIEGDTVRILRLLYRGRRIASVDLR